MRSNPRILIAVVASLATIAGCHRPAVAPLESSACRAPSASPTVSLASEPVENPAMVFDTAWTIIHRTHWDTTYNGVNWLALRDELRPKAAAAKTTGELRAILSDMVGRLKQSHFSIIPREASDVTPEASTRGETDRSGSAGVKIRLVDNLLLVTEVRDGSVAQRAGIRTGYVLDAVNGCSFAPRIARIPKALGERRVALSGYSMGTQALAGRVGDTVHARFLDGNNRPVETTLVLEKEPGTVVKFGNLPPTNSFLEWERVRVNGRVIGIIRWNIWMPILAAQFDAAIDSLRGSDAIVLDVRGNPGGVGGMSMGFSGHFIDSTITIGVMKQRGIGDFKFIANPRRVNSAGQRVQPYDGPVALVVDEISVSTTEIFGAGMQETGRARVFGTQTAGQALPSVPERLPNGDILYHAIANFLSPKGKQIEGDGVIPDVKVAPNRKALLEGKDPALDAALSWAASQNRRAM